MKIRLWIGLLTTFILGASLSGCGPASLPSNSFAGTWTANIGTVNFVQEGNKVTGAVDGYGDTWNESFAGTIDENGEAVFDTDILGGFTLVLEGDNYFKSTSPDLSFCGVRGENAELPAGCGFSGKWVTTSRFPAVDKGYILLTQTGADVTGELYNSMNAKYETFTGVVDWGKGWRANGMTTQRGELSLWINAAETGFELMYGESGNPQQLCAVREGIASAYLFSFTCKP